MNKLILIIVCLVFCFVITPLGVYLFVASNSTNSSITSDPPNRSEQDLKAAVARYSGQDIETINLTSSKKLTPNWYVVIVGENSKALINDPYTAANGMQVLFYATDPGISELEAMRRGVPRQVYQEFSKYER
jgi:hypothetical protein